MPESRTLLLATLVLVIGALPVLSSAQNEATLAAVLAARSEEDRARDAYRHPLETLTLFQVKPGMTVAEGLPGEGWYTRILANYLGGKGKLFGVNFADRIWPMYSDATDKWIEKRIGETGKFTAKVRQYTNNGITAKGFTFAAIPPEVAGTVDRVLMIRALHPLYRFEAQAGTLTQAMAAIRGLLQEGGLVGVVQHRAPESASDEWADGSHGYLKQSAVIAVFEKAGFELLESSEVNANPRDKPGPEDSVWRLPPTLRTSQNDPQLQAAMRAIGESDRMTLLFRKL